MSIAFPHCSGAFSDALAELVLNGTDTDADFVLDVLQNYHGEPSTHEVLKRIVARYPDDEGKLSKVSISFDNEGVVSGQFGMVEAHRRKKVAMEAWLDDPRPDVRTFAAKHIADLEQWIAHEQKRAEEDSAMRRLSFGADDGEAGDS